MNLYAQKAPLNDQERFVAISPSICDECDGRYCGNQSLFHQEHPGMPTPNWCIPESTGKKLCPKAQ